MDQKNQIDVSKITKIFAKMSYGENVYETKNGVEWLNAKKNFFAHIEKLSEVPNGIPLELTNILISEKLCTVNISEIDTIKQILLNTKKDTKWIEVPAIARSKILYSLGQEIEQNSSLFAEIELVLRGKIPRDLTTNIIPLLAQYFYFYSIFALIYSKENCSWEPAGTSVGIISNESALSNLGLHLAPALAAGYNVVLQVGTRIAPAVFLLVDLAKKVGIGQDVIRIVPSDDEELLPYFNSDNVSIITIFANLYNRKYRGVNYTNKKILAMCPSSIPIMIFDNADVDSVCEAVIYQFWNSNSLLACSENYIFVQENIMSTFLNKFKNRLKSVKIGRADENKIDLAYPMNKSVSKFNDFLENAKKHGYEIHTQSNDPWMPTLILGNGTSLKTNDDDEDITRNVAFVIPFRSTEEAIALANNLKYGLGISIWSENIRVTNDMTKKIETTNIWINKTPKFSADVSFSPMKKSGFGYFGGREGFYEYVEIGKTNSISQKEITSNETSHTINKTIDVAKKSQSTWKLVKKLDKINVFRKAVEFLDEAKSKLSDNKEKQDYELWIITALQCIGGAYKCTPSNTIESNKNVISFYVPKGVIVLDIKKKMEEYYIKFVLSAIFEGNSLIILEDSGKSMCTSLSKLFPPGVLNVCSEVDALNIISGRQDINVFIGSEGINPVFTPLPIQETTTSLNHSGANMLKKVTVVKNIWD